MADLKDKPQQASQIDQLFTLDIKTDNLKSFLENIVSVINNQSKTIASLQADMRTKSDQIQVSKCFDGIQQSISLYDNEFHKTIYNLIEKPKIENSGNAIDDNANKICNKLTMIGHACNYLYKGNLDWDQKLIRIEKDLAKKCYIDDMKTKVKKNKKKLLNEIEELRRKLQKQQDDLNRKTTLQINKFEEDVRKVEKNTLGKISDCEMLLQRRVTQEFVDNNCKALEERLLREIAKSKEDSFGNVFRQLEDLTVQLKNVDDIHHEKNKNIKKIMKEMEDMLLTKLCPLEKYENNKKIILDKFQDIDAKLINLDRRGDANKIMESLKDLVKELEDKIYGVDREEKQLEIRLNELQIKLESGALGGGEKGQGITDIDPHKICQLDSDLKRLKDDFDNQKSVYKTLENDMRRKFDNFEHKILGNFALLKQQESNSMSKEEIISMLERTKIFTEEKINQMAKELEDYKQKINSFKDLEKNIKKKFREIQENNDFSSTLNEKANQEEVRREFTHMDEKVRNLLELVNQFRREFESIEEFYNQLSMLLKTNQQETISVITGNNRIIPNRCVGCGNKGRQVYNVQDMKGYDGKMYRADRHNINSSNIYEVNEVFDIMPQSIIQEQYGKVPQYQKTTVTSFKERPTSAKTDQIYEQENTHLPVIQEGSKRPTSAKIKM